MSVTVQRSPGDNPGDPITSPMLTTAEAQLERGTYEINTNDRDRQTVAGAIIANDFLQPGTMHGVDIKGRRKNGLLTSYGYSVDFGVDSVNVSSTVILETIK